jgi:hypothetical protein
MAEPDWEPASPPSPGDSFDDRKPLLLGCAIALVVVGILGAAFLLGAYSVLQAPAETSQPPVAVE